MNQIKIQTALNVLNAVNRTFLSRKLSQFGLLLECYQDGDESGFSISQSSNPGKPRQVSFSLSRNGPGVVVYAGTIDNFSNNIPDAETQKNGKIFPRVLLAADFIVSFLKE